jgi:hypothetical protein
MIEKDDGMIEREMMSVHQRMSEHLSLRSVSHQPTLSSRYHMSGHLYI